MIIYLSMLETEAERDVFQKLYEENSHWLLRNARSIVRNDADAQDAVHNCFLKLADNFARYRHEPYDNLVKLCSTVVRNEANEIARGYQKEVHFTDETGLGEGDIPDTTPDILDQLVEEYERSLILQALDQLSEDERAFLCLQYGMGLKPKEIGELMGMSSVAVRKKMARLRNKLAAILEGEEYESLR